MEGMSRPFTSTRIARDTRDVFLRRPMTSPQPN